MKKYCKKMPEWALPVALGVGCLVLAAGTVLTSLAVAGKLDKTKLLAQFNKYKSNASYVCKEVMAKVKDWMK